MFNKIFTACLLGLYGFSKVDFPLIQSGFDVILLLYTVINFKKQVFNKNLAFVLVLLIIYLLNNYNDFSYQYFRWILMLNILSNYFRNIPRFLDSSMFFWNSYSLFLILSNAIKHFSTREFGFYSDEITTILVIVLSLQIRHHKNLLYPTLILFGILSTRSILSSAIALVAYSFILNRRHGKIFLYPVFFLLVFSFYFIIDSRIDLNDSLTHSQRYFSIYNAINVLPESFSLIGCSETNVVDALIKNAHSISRIASFDIMYSHTSIYSSSYNTLLDVVLLYGVIGLFLLAYMIKSSKANIVLRVLPLLMFSVNLILPGSFYTTLYWWSIGLNVDEK